LNNDNALNGNSTNTSYVTASQLLVYSDSSEKKYFYYGMVGHQEEQPACKKLK